MQRFTSSIRPLQFSFVLTAVCSLVSQSEATTICGVSATEGANGTVLMIIGNGDGGEKSLVRFQNTALRNVSVSWTTYNFEGTRNWLLCLSNSSERINFTAAYLKNFDTESGLQTVESWLASAHTMGFRKVIGADGRPVRGEAADSGSGDSSGGYYAEATPFNNLDLTVITEPTSINQNLTSRVVPEPGVALLGTLGVLGLLRRRRDS